MKPFFIIKLADTESNVGTEAEARATAERYARQNPGHRYVVYRAVAECQATIQPVAWEECEAAGLFPRFFKTASENLFVFTNAKGGAFINGSSRETDRIRVSLHGCERDHLEITRREAEKLIGREILISGDTVTLGEVV